MYSEYYFGKGDSVVTGVMSSRYKDIRDKCLEAWGKVDPGVGVKIIIKDTSGEDEETFQGNKVINELVEKVTTPFVLLLNDDVYPIMHGWVVGLLRCLQKYSLSCVAPNFTQKFDGYDIKLGSNMTICRKGFPLEGVSGGTLLCRTEDWREVGGYDENYLWNYDDVDLTWRLNELNNYDEGAMICWLLVHHPDKSTTSRNQEVYDRKIETTRVFHNKKWGIKEDGIKG